MGRLRQVPVSWTRSSTFLLCVIIMFAPHADARCYRSSDCSSQGLCVRASGSSLTECSCYRGYSGSECQISAGTSGCRHDNDCNARGYCSPYSGTCSCYRGWAGSKCQISFPMVCAAALTNTVVTIILVCSGCLVGFLLLVVLPIDPCCCCCRRRSKRNAMQSPNMIVTSIPGQNQVSLPGQTYLSWAYPQGKFPGSWACSQGKFQSAYAANPTQGQASPAFQPAPQQTMGEGP